MLEFMLVVMTTSRASIPLMGEGRCEETGPHHQEDREEVLEDFT